LNYGSINTGNHQASSEENPQGLSGQEAGRFDGNGNDVTVMRGGPAVDINSGDGSSSSSGGGGNQPTIEEDEEDKEGEVQDILNDLEANNPLNEPTDETDSSNSDSSTPLHLRRNSSGVTYGDALLLWRQRVEIYNQSGGVEPKAPNIDDFHRVSNRSINQRLVDPKKRLRLGHNKS
jgi:hypothetical protein